MACSSNRALATVGIATDDKTPEATSDGALGVSDQTTGLFAKMIAIQMMMAINRIMNTIWT